MADIITYNNIISVFEDIANRHYQIKTFKVGDQWEEDANTVSYPMLVVNPTSADMARGENGYATFEITMNVLVSDQVYKGEENENEVVSDTLQMIQDIIVEFNQHPYYTNSRFDIVGDLTFEPFTERNDDEVTGWQVGMTLRTPNIRKFCGIPVSEINGFEFDRPSCGTSGASGTTCLCIKSMTSDNPVIISEANGIYNWSLDPAFVTASTSGHTSIVGVSPIVVSSTSGLADYEISLSETFIVAATSGTALASTQGALPYLFANGTRQSVIPSFGSNNQIPNTTIQSVILSGNNNLITNVSDASAIITGDNNTIDASAFSNIAGGYSNEISTATWSTISGGINNEITGNASIIAGGRNNIISGILSGVLGGIGNTVKASQSAIIGGYQNYINSPTLAANIIGGSYNVIGTYTNYSTIAGGGRNEINGSYRSFIGMGDTNIILGSYNTTTIHNTILSGKNNNLTTSKYSSIFNGNTNSINSSNTASILGGRNNTLTSSNYGVILGGQGCSITTSSYGIAAGRDNDLTTSPQSLVISGRYNSITSSSDSAIVSGYDNDTSTSDYSFIGGGGGHAITGSSNSAILGGYGGKIYNSANAFIGGGKNAYIYATSPGNVIVGGGNNFGFNKIYGGAGQTYNNFIGGGSKNYINSTTNFVNYSTIVGGNAHTISDGQSFIGGGYQNRILKTTGTSLRAVIVGGSINTITNGIYSFIGGGDTNTITDSRSSSIIGGENNSIIDSKYSSILGGETNVITASGADGYSVILSGHDNTITTSKNSAIIVGQNGRIINSDYSVILSAPNYTNAWGYINNSNYSIVSGFNNVTGSQVNGGGIVLGGWYNQTNSDYSTILGGTYNNINNSYYSTIIGGSYNIAPTGNLINGANNSHIIGSGNTITSDSVIIIGNNSSSGFANSVLIGDSVIASTSGVTLENLRIYDTPETTTNRDAILQRDSDSVVRTVDMSAKYYKGISNDDTSFSGAEGTTTFVEFGENLNSGHFSTSGVTETIVLEAGVYEIFTSYAYQGQDNSIRDSVKINFDINGTDEVESAYGYNRDLSTSGASIYANAQLSSIYVLSANDIIKVKVEKLGANEIFPLLNECWITIKKL